MCVTVCFLWGRSLLKKAPPPDPHRENFNNWAHMLLFICTSRISLCNIAIATGARRFTRGPLPRAAA